MKLNEFARTVDAEDITPSTMNAETLYVVPDGYHGQTCVGFLCPCGCGGFHLLPTYRPGEKKSISPGWEMERVGDKVTLHPSLLNGCGAHFFIRDNKIIWCQ
ncbi:hypothetical protein SDC9_74205 [bioreactor metagenome]|uniref:Uncharacterized protein n=1 Tax=bioreactor metagenome TaxID=1076179 RepID=A0A644YGG5_9ZZZZ